MKSQIKAGWDLGWSWAMAAPDLVALLRHASDVIVATATSVAEGSAQPVWSG